MEEGHCWIRSKRKYHMSSSLDSSTNNPSPYDDHSWEEQAFAKDAAWSGCIWPPRSYSCSFCKREFKSAQALGGHMNVHRRDRARLKHQHSPQNEILSDDDVEKTQPRIPVQISFTSWGCLYPYSLSGLAHSTNPNSDACSHVPASPSKVLATSNNKISREKPQTPLCIGFHESYPDLPSKSRSNLTEDFRFCSHRHDLESGVEKSLKGLDSGCTSEGDRHKSKTDVAESLSLFTSQAYTPVQFETKETDSSFKKRKVDASSIPFFPNSCSVDSHHMQSQMFEFSPRSVEEIDLELSLGYKSRE